jgi:hypothetical protein
MKPRIVNTILVSISLGVMLIVTMYTVNFIDYAAPIPYENWKKISLDDFKGFKRPFQKHQGSDRFAFIDTEIRLEPLPGGKWKVSTFFHPSRSYVYNPRIWYKGLLRHELYHLHVTEIASRQLRKKIAELGEPSNSTAHQLLRETYIDEWKMQSAYDEQSNHSQRLHEQKQWEVKIDSTLETLIKYSDVIIQ